MGATSFIWGCNHGDAEGSHLGCDAVLLDVLKDHSAFIFAVKQPV
jgi:hypothetical protein